MHRQSPYPSTSSRAQQWSVQNQTSYAHTFFNNSGTIQEQPDQTSYYRPQAIPSQATHHHHLTTNQNGQQTTVHRRALQPAPLRQVAIPAAQAVHHPPAPQARNKSMPQQLSQSNAPQTAAIIQHRTVARGSHEVAPTAARSVRSAERGYESMSVLSTIKLTG